MPWTKTVDAANARLVWAFGRPYQFHWVTIVDDRTNAQITLDATNYFGGAAAGQQFQKSQIVLHGTDGNNEARATLEGFRTGPLQPGGWRAAAHIVVERTRAHTAPWSPAEGVPARAARTGVARLHPDAVFDDTDDFIDVVRLTDLNESVIHGSSVNKNAIGIEHVNAQNDFHLVRDETMDPATRRPRDRNRWIHIGSAGSTDARGDMQAFEDEQYNSIILMLRAIAIEQRIPRQFFGDTWNEKSSHYTKWDAGAAPSAAEQRERKTRIFDFRGLIQHWNTEVKLCPGSFALNRMFRGIIDEWWLPVELTGTFRPYYSGPFWNPTFTAPDNGGQPTKPAWFRWLRSVVSLTDIAVESTVYHDVDLDALTETRSYFDLNDVNNYYSHCETEEGGLFPVGQNGVWHGGVHIEAGGANPIVYAAASGTIVAARLSSNPATDGQSGYGSQRFVLIRHAVHWKTEASPNAPAGHQQRINYTDNPSYVFSLYMHLGSISDPYSEHRENPRWYNKWLRDEAKRRNLAADDIPPRAELDEIVGMTADGNKGRVFNPGIEVSVGDVLGLAGEFAQWTDPNARRRMLHFEIISHRDEEITVAGNRHAIDDDQDAVCDADIVNQELGAAAFDPGMMLSVVAPDLRDVRVRHRSTWSWDRRDLLSRVASDAWLNQNWPHLQRMMWVQDALAVNPDLRAQLGDSNFFWHYHPITFMAAINRLILHENREITDAPFHDVKTNVNVNEDYFLTNFVDFRAGNWNPASADNSRVQPYEFVAAAAGFSATRADLACRASTAVPITPHSPDVPIPQETFFSLALLGLFERVRQRFNAALTITCAQVCAPHLGEAGRCCRNEIQGHGKGVAVDFHPNRNGPSITSLWRELGTVRTEYNAEAHLHAGTACSGNLPVGFGGMDFKAQTDDVTTKLNASPPQALTAAEIRSFCVHLELTPV